MSSQYNPSSTYNAYCNLLKDLEGFIEVAQVEIVFNCNGQAFLQGHGFKEPLTANPDLHHEIRQQMREILVKHLGQTPNIELSQSN